jgi:predicted esterase
VTDLGFEHVFRAATGAAMPTLLLLHGTGGNEHDLIPVAERIAPAAAVLSPRGKVLEGQMPRFFRRLAEGVFDLEDLVARTRELAGFVEASAARYGFDPTRVVAVGFSNGANIAASLLLLTPSVLSGAILFRAVVPIVPDPLPSLAGKRILMSNGRVDPLIPAAQAETLADLFRRCGAEVTLEWQPGGHTLTKRDLELAARFLAGL